MTETSQGVSSDRWGQRAGFYLNVCFTVLVDVAFLGLWLSLQSWVSVHLANWPPLQGLDEWVLPTFRVIFGASTLVPVLLFVADDLYLVGLRMSRRFR